MGCAHATVTAAALLRKDKMPPDSVWRTVKGLPDEATDVQPRTVTAGWHELVWILSHWLLAGNVRPYLHYDGGRPQLTWGSVGAPLFAHTAIQLQLAVCGGGASALWMWNGLRAIRTPNPNRRNYCEECRKRGVPHRDAVRAYRARP